MQPCPTTLPSVTTLRDEEAGWWALDECLGIGQEERLRRNRRVLQEAGEPLAAALAFAAFGATAVGQLAGNGR